MKDAFSKLQNLQTHYAELHAAYSTATQTSQNHAPKEYTDQISKLQTALSVAIEEKTVYQSDVRTLRTKMQALEADNKDMHVSFFSKYLYEFIFFSGNVKIHNRFINTS